MPLFFKDAALECRDPFAFEACQRTTSNASTMPPLGD
jgi:hypothetical protein